jgi:hypothetical protein
VRGARISGKIVRGQQIVFSQGTTDLDSFPSGTDSVDESSDL